MAAFPVRGIVQGALPLTSIAVTSPFPGGRAVCSLEIAVSLSRFTQLAFHFCKIPSRRTGGERLNKVILITNLTYVFV